jgi:hypothetical protein
MMKIMVMLQFHVCVLVRLQALLVSSNQNSPAMSFTEEGLKLQKQSAGRTLLRAGKVAQPWLAEGKEQHQKLCHQVAADLPVVAVQ